MICVGCAATRDLAVEEELEGVIGMRVRVVEVVELLEDARERLGADACDRLLETRDFPVLLGIREETLAEPIFRGVVSFPVSDRLFRARESSTAFMECG